jgi:hypothetical protein
MTLSNERANLEEMTNSNTVQPRFQISTILLRLSATRSITSDLLLFPFRGQVGQYDFILTTINHESANQRQRIKWQKYEETERRDIEGPVPTGEVPRSLRCRLGVVDEKHLL